MLCDIAVGSMPQLRIEITSDIEYGPLVRHLAEIYVVKSAESWCIAFSTR